MITTASVRLAANTRQTDHAPNDGRVLRDGPLVLQRVDVGRVGGAQPVPSAGHVDQGRRRACRGCSFPPSRLWRFLTVASSVRAERTRPPRPQFAHNFPAVTDIYRESH